MMDSKQEFIDLIKSNQGLIYKVTRVYTYSKEDEQDLYQEIVYQLWKSFGSFKNQSKLTTWMYRVALNTAITYLNKEKKQGNTVPIDEGVLNRSEADDSLKSEQLEIMYAHIKRLNTIEKGIILLYLEGKSYDEMAIITGFTASNIGTRLNRIKQKISDQIKS